MATTRSQEASRFKAMHRENEQQITELRTQQSEFMQRIDQKLDDLKNDLKNELRQMFREWTLEQGQGNMADQDKKDHQEFKKEGEFDGNSYANVKVDDRPELPQSKKHGISNCWMPSDHASVPYLSIVDFSSVEEGSSSVTDASKEESSQVLSEPLEEVMKKPSLVPMELQVCHTYQKFSNDCKTSINEPINVENYSHNKQESMSSNNVYRHFKEVKKELARVSMKPHALQKSPTYYNSDQQINNDAFYLLEFALPSQIYWKNVNSFQITEQRAKDVFDPGIIEQSNTIWFLYDLRFGFPD